MNAWIGLIGVVIGVFLTGIVTQRLNEVKFEHEREFKNQQTIRSKLEEITQVMDEIGSEHDNAFLNGILFIKDLDRDRINKMLRPIPLIRLKMLIDFYAPEISSLYDSLDVASKLRHKVMRQIVQEPPYAGLSEAISREAARRSAQIDN